MAYGLEEKFLKVVKGESMLLKQQISFLLQALNVCNPSYEKK
jgi:hypothetical protein